MTEYLFSPHDQAVVPITTGEIFPVRRVFCIGKNYADHVKEMGGSLGDTPPVFFSKPADAVICPTAVQLEVPFPTRTENLHFEGELVMALKSGGTNIAQAEAMAHVYGVALGCDLTRRDLQFACKKSGTPWDIAKSFDHSAVLGAITPMDGLSSTQDMALKVNGQVRQTGQADQMIYSPARIIAELSTFFALKAGDLIFTGTPQGVGALLNGDRVQIEGAGLSPLTFVIG